MLFCMSAPAGALAGGAKPYTIAHSTPNPYDVTTQVAVALAVQPIYRAASTRAGKLRDLQLYTPDGEALQTYELLASEKIGRTVWEQISVPMRPNGTTGWIKRSWLASTIVSHTLVVVDRATRRLTVYRHGAVVLTAPVGVGKPSTPTPAGHFWISESFPSSNPFYGPWAFGTTDYSVLTEWPGGGIVGLHGTDEPRLIPGDPSHGCVRLRNRDDLKLKSLISIGAAVWIE